MKYPNAFVASLLLLAALGARAAENTGPLAGTIVGRDTSGNELKVAHGDVPGLMGAMTMAYEVRGQTVASLPNDGTKVSATLHESDGAFWLTDVRVAGDQGGAMQATSAADFLMRQASGTSMNPAAAPMHMTMTQRRDWMLMLHGTAFVDQTMQSGPRGAEKLFSTNWVMGMASRPLGGGQLMLRSMLSLEPLTVGKKYPLLFQTGETIGGRPIIDAQHPHDFFMELAAEYAHPLTANTIGYIYAAPFGDPSLGPVAYPHRASASEIPQATLGHHVQDSTHIAGSVLTVGAQSGRLGYALSGFHGQEPDEERWDIDTGKLDSWAARVTFDPTPNWTAQISTGHLRHPEAAEPGNIRRTTASVAYSKATGIGQWDTSVIFGRNEKSEAHGDPTTSSWLAESVLQFGGRNYVTGRAEIVDKDELFAGQDVPHDVEHGVFRVKALTLGYSRDLLATRGMTGALGGNVTLYSIPGAIEPFYGSNPYSLNFFLRLRGGSSGGHGAH
jgi:Cu/Ag efflux protein CusF